MVRGESLDRTREPINTRQQTALQQRRNSVSDIADFFNAKSKDNSDSSPMPPKNTSRASRKPSGKKDKEREKELNAARENIRRYINDNSMEEANMADNTSNGEIQSSKSNHVNDHAETSAINKDETEISQPSQAMANRSIATQTSDDEVLTAIKELALKCNKLEDAIEDPKNGIAYQLAKTQKTVTDLYTDINGAVSGLKVQMQSVVQQAENNSKKINSMEDSQKRMAAMLGENKRMLQELKLMQGVVQRMSQQAEISSNQILDLTRRGMEQNLIFHGVDNLIEIQDARAETPMYSRKERCKYSLLEFLKKELNIDIQVEDVWKAHRMGAIKPGKVRPLVAKVSYPAKELIMEHMPKLKGKSNPTTKQVYFIGEQIPEGVAEKRKQISNKLKILKDKNDSKPKAERSTIQVVNDNILIDGQILTPEVTTPQPAQLFPDMEEQKAIDLIQSHLQEAESNTTQNSEFRGLAIKAHTIKDVNRAYVAVMQRFPTADHVMMAYALRENEVVKSGFCDDKEYGAGAKLRKLLYEEKQHDTAIFVVRKYGGLHLGYSRFGVIESVAREALQMLK